MYTGPDGAAAGDLEGKEIPAGLVLPHPDGTHIIETAEATEAKRRHAVSNVRKTKWLVGGGVALFFILIIGIAASVKKEAGPSMTVWDANPSVRVCCATGRLTPLARAVRMF